MKTKNKLLESYITTPPGQKEGGSQVSVNDR